MSATFAPGVLSLEDSGAGSLSGLLEFDHVVTILPTGEIIDTAPVSAPQAYDPSVGETEISGYPGWELITSGLTGQYGYGGPWLHDSELIQGAVARRIIEHAADNGGGYYVAIYATYSCQECGGAGLVYSDGEEIDCPAKCEPGGTFIEGWAIARHALAVSA